MISSERPALPMHRSAFVTVLLIAVLAFAAVVAVLLVIQAVSADGDDLPGAITYATDQGHVTVRPNGERLGTRFVEEPVRPTSSDGVWEAPDGSATARLEQSAGGAWLVVETVAGETRLTQLAGPDSPPLISGQKPVAHAANGIPLLVAWSPDGAQLAYGSAMEGRDVLHIIDTGTWKEQSYGIEDGFVGELVWSPDGRYVAISSYSRDGHDHTAYIADASDGGITKLVDGCHIVWSPDGRHIALHRDPYVEPGLWVLSIDGQKRYLLADEVGAAPLAWLAE